jgi:hypothetical protein
MQYTTVDRSRVAGSSYLVKSPSHLRVLSRETSAIISLLVVINASPVTMRLEFWFAGPSLKLAANSIQDRERIAV